MFFRLLIFSFLLLIPLAAQTQEHEVRQANLIVFLVDDMGWQDTSLPFAAEATELNHRYHTPNMERLASEGLMFTDAHAAAICSPSRCSLMTGMNPARHRVTNWTLHRNQGPDRPHPRIRAPDWSLNGLAIEEGTPHTTLVTPLPRLLHKAGYHTIHVGKAHFGAIDTPAADPTKLGFDVNIAGHAAGGPGSYHGEHNFSAVWRGGGAFWDVPGLEKYHGLHINLTEALTIEALDELDHQHETAPEQPFFLYVSHYTVHAPWEIDRRFEAHYRAMGLSGKALALATMVEGMDKSLGDILSWLDLHQLTDDTLILFMSDNGAPAQVPQNIPLHGHKVQMYEGGHRVPMIVRWPGHTAVNACQDLAVIIEDLFPTLLATAGLEPQIIDTIQTVDGLDLTPLFHAEPSPQFAERPLLWHFPHTYDIEPASALRVGPWKLIHRYLDNRNELYNLSDDLSEEHNLAEDNPRQLRRMLEIMNQLLTERDAQMPLHKDSGESFPLPTPKPTS